MLLMVIHITNGIIINWGEPSFKSFGGFNSTCTSTLHIIGICGWELHSICYKKCIHAMSMGYFLKYIAFYSWPCIIALVPLCSLYGYLAGAITFLYPLATKLFMSTGPKVVYSLCPWHQSLYFNHFTQGFWLRNILDNITSFLLCNCIIVGWFLSKL